MAHVRGRADIDRRLDELYRLGLRSTSSSPTGRCNTKGLSDLGRYLVGRLIARHMLIETDHLRQKARQAYLRMWHRAVRHG